MSLQQFGNPPVTIPACIFKRRTAPAIGRIERNALNNEVLHNPLLPLGRSQIQWGAQIVIARIDQSALIRNLTPLEITSPAGR